MDTSNGPEELTIWVDSRKNIRSRRETSAKHNGFTDSDRPNTGDIPTTRRPCNRLSPSPLTSAASTQALLLKYEVRQLIKSNCSEYARGQRRHQVDEETVESAPVYRRPHRRTHRSLHNDQSSFSPLTTTASSLYNKMPEKGCKKCQQLQQRVATLEHNLEQEKLTNNKFRNLEEQLEQMQQEKNDFSKQIKKLEREIKRTNGTLEEEKLQTRRLGIKLEDANYEIGRLRQELINTQLENEKIVEENEDFAVDNEDLMKERDEIIQIYEELFRESERLKHEVQIWKTVFSGATDNSVGRDEETDLTKVDVDQKESSTPSSSSSSSSEDEDDEGLGTDLEEDQSLLLRTKNDVTVKKMEVSTSFDIGEEIGRGKFGKVYKITSKNGGDVFAAKYIKVTTKLREDVLDTIDVMKRLHHVRLIRLFDVYDLGSQIICVLEYVGGGILFERIVEKNSLTEADCAIYMKQILQGVHHLHSNNIVHLELKPENIVCANRQTMDIKIIDFGLAKHLDERKDVRITAGSPEFVAPEILSFDPVSLQSDLWSIGVLTYVMLSGISPFHGGDDNDTLMNVSCGEYSYDEKSFENITQDAKKFIDRLLVSCPKKRKTVGACLRHPWLNTNWKAKQQQIDLQNMKNFLGMRKERGNISASRSIRRFSSFGVGHGLLQHGNAPNLRKTPQSSRHLLVPNIVQTETIAEGDENEEDDTLNNNNNKPLLPVVSITGVPSHEHSRQNSIDVNAPVEDTSTPDGLRSYLQRMISTGMLPGGAGPPSE